MGLPSPHHEHKTLSYWTGHCSFHQNPFWGSRFVPLDPAKLIMNSIGVQLLWSCGGSLCLFCSTNVRPLRGREGTIPPETRPASNCRTSNQEHKTPPLGGVCGLMQNPFRGSTFVAFDLAQPIMNSIGVQLLGSASSRAEYDLGRAPAGRHVT